MNTWCLSPIGCGRAGERGDSTQFYPGRLCPKVQTLIFLYTILVEKGTPFIYLLLTTGTRTRNLKLELELCILLTTVNTLSSKYSINHKKPRTFSRLFDSHKIHLSALLGIFICQNDRFPQPFHIIQLVKSLPFHIPKA